MKMMSVCFLDLRQASTGAGRVVAQCAVLSAEEFDADVLSVAQHSAGTRSQASAGISGTSSHGGVSGLEVLMGFHFDSHQKCKCWNDCPMTLKIKIIHSLLFLENATKWPHPTVLLGQ